MPSRSIADRRALARAIGGTIRADVDPLNATNFETEHLFGVWIAQGMQDPAAQHAVPAAGRPGPAGSRLLRVDRARRWRRCAKPTSQHVAAVLGLMGVADAGRRAAAIVDLETRMAAVHATRVQSADVSLPQVWTREALAAKAPGLDWPALLDAAGLQGAPAFTVWHPAAVTGLAALAGSAPLAAWKDWLRVPHRQPRAPGSCPRRSSTKAFAFYGKTLNGTPEQRPRWQRGVDATSLALGEVGRPLYVERHFPPEAKAKVRGDGRRHRPGAFSRRIDALTWMTPETKAKAKAKVSTLYVGVGYPDKWIDYGPLQIATDDAIGNAERAELFEYRRQLAKLGQPVDRTEWWMTPQTVNAVNLPLQNALNFPAAILQNAVLRSGARRRRELRRDRRDHRPRDQPQLRRPGQPVRRPGPARQLVDAAGPRRTSRARARRWRRSTTPTGRSRTWRSTATRCSARTSPISPAWPPPTTPIDAVG